MLEVNDHIIADDLDVILKELKRQLAVEGFPRFEKVIVSGDNLQTNCPFHKDGQERKPSFGILTRKKGNDPAGTCHCFGCGWTGSFSEMVSGCFGYDDLGEFGSKWLIRNFLSVSVESRPDIIPDDIINRRKHIINTGNKYVDESELEKYRQYHTYMWKRKLTPDIVDLFDIGYDEENKCITFPNRDITGQTLFVAKRSVVTKFFQYPSNVQKPVYGLFEFSRLSPPPLEVIICESMIDALTCWVYGKVAFALNGLGDDFQFSQLNHLPVRKYIIATDMDEYGIKARKRIKQALKNKLVTEYVWDAKIAKDINDMSKEMFDNLQEVF